MTQPTEERIKDKTDLQHGLTEAQIVQLFGDQGEFADPNKAYDVLRRKAELAAEWLSSFWKGPFPAWLIEAQEQGRIDWQAKIDAATNDDPENPGHKDWLQSMVGAWEKESGIEQPSPLRHVVFHYFQDVRGYGREEEYDKAQEIVLKLLVDADTGTNRRTKRELKYAKKVLETHGEQSLNSAFSRGGYTPDFKFPKPLMGFANYSSTNDGMLY